MMPAQLQGTTSHFSNFNITTENYDASHRPHHVTCSLNTINNTAMNLYVGCICDRLGSSLVSDINNFRRDTIIRYATHDNVNSVSLPSDNPIDNSVIPGLRVRQDIQRIPLRSTMSQESRKREFLLRRYTAVIPNEIRRERGIRSPGYFKNLSSRISFLSKNGIEIPNGTSPHTLYGKLRSEQYIANLLGHDFDRVGFQRRINDEARIKLPDLINRWNSDDASHPSLFSALCSRSIQKDFLRAPRQE